MNKLNFAQCDLKNIVCYYYFHQVIYQVWSEKAIKRYPESRVGLIEKVWLSEKMGSNEKKGASLVTVGNYWKMLATLGNCWQQ